MLDADACALAGEGETLAAAEEAAAGAAAIDWDAGLGCCRSRRFERQKRSFLAGPMAASPRGCGGGWGAWKYGRECGLRPCLRASPGWWC